MDEQSAMKGKHIRIRIEQCLALAKASNCPRRKFGALLLDPTRNVILMDGYNGGPRGGGHLCGGDVCLRDTQSVVSGTHIEIGCHHAEMNVICNAAAAGVACRGAWLIVTGEPCLMCAKMIHHAGITKVLCVSGGYMGSNGVQYLKDHDVEVEPLEGPQDPRLEQEATSDQSVSCPCGCGGHQKVRCGDCGNETTHRILLGRSVAWCPSCSADNWEKIQ